MPCCPSSSPSCSSPANFNNSLQTRFYTSQCCVTPDLGWLLLQHKPFCNGPDTFLQDAGLEQPVCLSTASLAVTDTGQFCREEPCGYLWREELRELLLPLALPLADSGELCVQPVHIRRVRGAACPHKPSCPTAPPGRDASS